MTRILCALAVVCLGGFATGVSPALGAFPGDNGKIAFDSERDGGDTDIWTMSPDGSNQVNLTANSKGNDASASWRADGQKIAFMSDRATPSNPTPPGFPGPDFEIFVMNADGSNQTQITFNGFDDEAPAWSPNGKRIVFQRDFDTVRGQVDYDILRMRANGAHERNLTNSPGVQDFGPDWSPDGRRIAFSGERDGDAEIYTMRPNGSGLHQRAGCRPGDALPGRDLHDARRRQRPDQAHVRRPFRLLSRLVAGWPQDRLHELPRCHRGGRGQRGDLHDARRRQRPGETDQRSGIRRRPRLAATRRR
jgi:Tol biopolymer transport system component